jgi:tetratricopeptide (TPR) repeat protein
MSEDTLKKMEAAIGKVVEKMGPEIVVEVQALSEKEPENPTPYLSLAILAGFEGDFTQSKKYLDKAESLLKKKGEATVMKDPELLFSAGLLTALKSEYSKMVEMENIPPARINTASLVNLAGEWYEGITYMGRALRYKELRNNEFIKTTYGMVISLSLFTGPKSRLASKGRSILNTIFKKGNEANKNLAGFALLYSYRHNRDYRNALRIGLELEKRHPRSPLPKTMLGSIYGFMGMCDKAVNYYSKAAELDPHNPSIQLGYSNALHKIGKLNEARDVLKKAEDLDVRKKLSDPIKRVKEVIELKPRLSPKVTTSPVKPRLSLFESR